MIVDNQSKEIEMAEIELISELTCPQCGHKSSETMPTDNCQYYYECQNCGALLKPEQGDCCVFCSYGTVPCPPVQKALMAGNQGACCQ
jgi:hypothetical protein